VAVASRGAASAASVAFLLLRSEDPVVVEGVEAVEAVDFPSARGPAFPPRAVFFPSASGVGSGAAPFFVGTDFFGPRGVGSSSGFRFFTWHRRREPQRIL
jgi:hypothetical protein